MEPATVMNFNDFIKSFPHEVASQIDAHFWRQKLVGRPLCVDTSTDLPEDPVTRQNPTDQQDN